MSDHNSKDSEDLIDEEARRRFESNWNVSKISDIESYLPDRSDNRYWPTLEELLYIDLEFGWKHYESHSFDETVSVNLSPTIRLKAVTQRLDLQENRDLLQRLWDYDASLREKSKVRPADDSESGLKTIEFDLASDTSPQNATQKVVGNTEDSILSSGQFFGKYELLDPLGRGGMGLVFRAIERATGRQVALKMIRSNIVNRVDEETRKIVMERFQTEAKAVASLEHPNIVTLYEVGVHEQTPYLSMQLVDGEDLASRIRQTVLEGKAAARYMRQVAQAIAAAHQQGIIHRDLKPHNILLHSARDEALVTDFGLAKLTDNADGLTETGELLGTPGYMSPEQAQGLPVNRMTDIYSLGATLYCLVAGRAPFQAADTLKTLEQIVHNPPLPLRDVNPDVDRNLETICLKCLEKDPSRRYSSADQLADDLGRYIDGQPILARPVAPVEKAYRWCRRNPLPTSIGVSLVLLVVLATVSLFVVDSFRKQSDYFATQNEKNANLAFQSSRDELFLIAEDATLKLPGMDSTRKSLLLPLREFFERFIEVNENFVEAKIEFAFAHYALGRIAHEVQEYDSALEHLARAIDLQSAERRLKPNDDRISIDLSNSLNLRGECLLKMEKRDGALRDLERTQQLREKLVKKSPGNFEYHRKLANVQMNLANWWAYRGDDEAETKAIELYSLSNQNRQKFFSSIKDDQSSVAFNTQYDRAKCLFNLALSKFNLEQNRSAVEDAEAAMSLFGKLRAERPNDLFVMRDFARCGELLAELNLENGPGVYDSEIASVYQHIVNLYPEEIEYRWLLASTLVRIADSSIGEFANAKANGDSKVAELEFVSAKSLLDQARKQVEKLEPASSDQRLTRVAIGLGLVVLLIEEGRNLEADQQLKDAKKQLDMLSSSEHPHLASFQARWSGLDKIVTSLLKSDL